MANLKVKHRDNPKLQQIELEDGRISLYLEYYLGREQWIDETTGKTKVKHHRKKESLHLYLLKKPHTPIERQTNTETLAIAKEIRNEKEQELNKDRTGKRVLKDRKINFIDYFQAYNDRYTKKDIRMMQIALQRFKDFLSNTPEYERFIKSIKPEQLTHDMIVDFTDYLQSRSVGEGAKSIYQRFKKVIKYAIEHDIMIKNPCTGIVIKVDEQVLKKAILSLDEERELMNTTYEHQNPIVRNAFIFCLYTGLRFCDVKDLKYSNVDYSNKLLSFEQNKTKGHSAASGVVIPLNDGLLSLIGKGENDDLIFILPSHTMCLKALRRWTKRAGIEKHITWHCARHSFAVNVLNNGANIKTVASLLGHSGLRHTEKYTRAVDSLKRDAINGLPELDL